LGYGRGGITGSPLGEFHVELLPGGRVGAGTTQVIAAAIEALRPIVSSTDGARPSPVRFRSPWISADM